MTRQALARTTTRLFIVAIGLSGPALVGPFASPAAEPAAQLIANDAAYTRPVPAEGARGRTLDLYGPAVKSGGPRPVVLFVHGGAWRFGDKAMVGSMPRAFVEQGYLFASANYRLEDSVSPREQAGDVAQAVKWLHDHVEEHGGAPGKIFLLGHSAGAHLVALVGTDERLLKACGLGWGVIQGVVLLDGAGYDVPRQVAGARLERMQQLYQRAFGDDEQAQREASPVTHVAPGKAYPPFLIFHVGRRLDSQEQSELLAAKLREAGGQARTIHEPDKNHLTLNRELGLPGDGPTGKICEFLKDMSGRD